MRNLIDIPGTAHLSKGLLDWALKSASILQGISWECHVCKGTSGLGLQTKGRMYRIISHEHMVHCDMVPFLFFKYDGGNARFLHLSQMLATSQASHLLGWDTNIYFSLSRLFTTAACNGAPTLSLKERETSWLASAPWRNP